jgi:pilus assembly protein Flp/PilA
MDLEPRHLHGDDGASAVEYSFLVAAIAAVIVLVVFSLGRLTGEAYSDTCDSMEQVSTWASASSCP